MADAVAPNRSPRPRSLRESGKAIPRWQIMPFFRVQNGGVALFLALKRSSLQCERNQSRGHRLLCPGGSGQFDWSHEIVVIGGVTTTVKVAHVRLCHSRMMFVRAYPRETQEMVFDAHERAFAFFRGACQRGIYDNMKTAVDDGVRRQGPPVQSPLPPDVLAPSRRAGRLHAGCGLGEGPGREPGRAGARALLHATVFGSRATGS